MQSIDKQTIKYNLFLTSYLKKQKQNKKTKGKFVQRRRRSRVGSVAAVKTSAQQSSSLPGASPPAEVGVTTPTTGSTQRNFFFFQSTILGADFFFRVVAAASFFFYFLGEDFIESRDQRDSLGLYGSRGGFFFHRRQRIARAIDERIVFFLSFLLKEIRSFRVRALCRKRKKDSPQHSSSARVG